MGKLFSKSPVENRVHAWWIDTVTLKNLKKNLSNVFLNEVPLASNYLFSCDSNLIIEDYSTYARSSAPIHTHISIKNLNRNHRIILCEEQLNMIKDLVDISKQQIKISYV